MRRLFTTAFVLLVSLLAGCMEPSFHLTAEGDGPGWVTLVLSSNQPIGNATLSLARDARLDNCTGNTCYFSYWVSPTDPSGNYTARYLADGKSGKLGVSILNRADYVEKEGITFYWTGNESLNRTLQAFTANATAVRVFLEPGKTPRNAAAVKAEVVVIATLTALNKTVHTYVVSGDNCTYVIAGKNETHAMSVEKCMNERYPTVQIDVPEYPTTQVRVDDSSFTIQSPGPDVIQAAKAVSALLIDAQKLFK